MEPDNNYSGYFDTIASNIYILNITFMLLAGGGSYLIWKVLSDPVNTTSVILTPTNPASTVPIQTTPAPSIPSLGI